MQTQEMCDATPAVASPEPGSHATARVRRARGRPLDHATARRVAASLPSDAPSQTAITRALRKEGVVVNAAAIAAVGEAIKVVRSRRDARRKLLHQASLNGPGHARIARLPRGTPAERLRKLRVAALDSTARRALRIGAAGGTSFRVDFVVSAEEVDYRIEIGRNWNTYRGAFKGWSAREDHHLLKVPRDWRVRVQRRGLAIVDGMMTLDAHALEHHGEIELFAATWVRQARGFSVAVHRGVIARLGSTCFHAPDRERAIGGVRRKARIVAGEIKGPRSSYAPTVDEFIRRYQRHEIEISLQDARATGSCEYGIRSWCDAVGLDYNAGAEPMAAVLDGFSKRPMPEVRRAVVHAVRAHRQRARAREA